MKYTRPPHHFIKAFALIVIILSVLKCVKPDIGERTKELLTETIDTIAPAPATAATHIPDSIRTHSNHVDSLLLTARSPLRLLTADGKPVRNRVTSVTSYDKAFPDLNDVQLATAQSLGVPHIKNRIESATRKNDLVYIADNPFYSVQQLNHSIPYLIPRAAYLLGEIARAFNDSLATKGFPPHKLIITSVMRTAEDIDRLKRHNANASENSCHRYGTTIDISYNRFLQINDDGTDSIRWVTAFKQILAEVLEDQRLMGTCYVKHEVKQSCFHITAR